MKSCYLVLGCPICKSHCAKAHPAHLLAAALYITVILSGLLSFLPDYCHSFQIIVIPSNLVSFLLNIVIPFQLLPFQKIVILNSFSTLPYPKGQKDGHRRWPCMRVKIDLVKLILTDSTESTNVYCN